MPPCLDLMCQQLHRKHMCRYLKIYCVRVTGFYLNQSTNIVQKNVLNTTIKSKSRLNIYSLIIVCTVLLPSGLLKYVSLHLLDIYGRSESLNCVYIFCISSFWCFPSVEEMQSFVKQQKSGDCPAVWTQDFYSMNDPRLDNTSVSEEL